MNVASQGGGVSLGGMANHGAFSHQNVPDAYRYANLHVQQHRLQQDFTKPANPPLKMLVPSEMVGAIIGRGGATIREITKASRARVDVHRNYELETGGANQGQQQQQLQQQQHAHNGGVSALSNNAINSEKVISIYGKEGDSISTACKKILEVMDTEFKKIRQNRLECGVPGFMNGMMPMGKPQMMMPETALKLLAPNILIGRIIGKQGKKVNEIKDKSGAKITVSNVYDINSENPERTIIITGGIDAMSAAESKISEILRVCHQQEMNKFSHPGAEGNGFYSPPRYRDNNNTSNNSNMSSSVEFNSPTSPYSNYLASRGFQASRGGGNQSHLAGPPAMMGTSLDVSHNSVTSQGSGPPMLPHHYTQMPPPHLGGPPPVNEQGQSNPYPSDPNYDTVFLYVPAASVGAIIGKKGESVRHITRTTGAIIKIAAENKEKPQDVDAASPSNNDLSALDKSGASDQPLPPRDASKTPGEKSVAITATFDAQCRAIAQIFKKLYEERFFGNDPPFLALDLIIPSSQMGKVLGKQKLKIRTIERRTGVNIRVPENKAVAPMEEGVVEAEVEAKKEAEDAMSYVTIRGTLTQMIQAVTMVKEILHGEFLMGPGFMGPPGPPHMYPPFHGNPIPYHTFRGNRGRSRF